MANGPQHSKTGASKLNRPHSAQSQLCRTVDDIIYADTCVNSGEERFIEICKPQFHYWTSYGVLLTQYLLPRFILTTCYNAIEVCYKSINLMKWMSKNYACPKLLFKNYSHLLSFSAPSFHEPDSSPTSARTSGHFFPYSPFLGCLTSHWHFCF